MVILIRKRHLHVLTLFLSLFFCAVLLLWQDRAETLSVMGETKLPESPRIFVIDAGHGGEDGGAVAADGTPESGLNLEIALRLNDLLRFCGEKTVLVRSEDISLNDPGLATFRQRKSSDLKNRVDFVNNTSDAILISIHQNALPSVPSVHGAQAFYNKIPGAKDLAEKIQNRLNQAVNQGNEKSTRAIPESIYLMKQSHAPSVLVECGFLSNAEETQKLKSPSHQIQITAAILSGLLAEPVPF